MWVQIAGRLGSIHAALDRTLATAVRVSAGMDPELRRAALVALNAHQELSREAICRLALALDAWTGSTTPLPPGRAEAMRVGNLGQMLAYARSVRRVYEQRGGEAPGQEIPLPGLPKAESQVAVPARVLGQLVGVLAIESEQKVAFRVEDEALLGVVATLVASAIEIDWAHERSAGDAASG